MGFWAALAVSLILSVVSYLLQPRPKQPKPPAAQDMDGPTSEAGRPVPVVFGTVTVKGLNVLWWGDKNTHSYGIST